MRLSFYTQREENLNTLRGPSIVFVICAFDRAFVIYRCMQRPDVFPAPPRPPTSRYTRWHALQAFVRSSVNSERASLFFVCASRYDLSLIHISEPTRLLSISYAVFCL